MVSVSAGERACHRLTSRERSRCLGNPHFSYNLVARKQGNEKSGNKARGHCKEKKRNGGGGGAGDRGGSYAKKEKELFFFSFCADDDVTLRGISPATLPPATKLLALFKWRRTSQAALRWPGPPPRRRRAWEINAVSRKDSLRPRNEASTCSLSCANVSSAAASPSSCRDPPALRRGPSGRWPPVPIVAGGGALASLD